MTDATVAAAKATPTTRFIGVDQGYDPKAVTAKNVTGLIFPEDQAGYGAGYLAGLMTKTNKLGQVLGLKIPPVEKFAKGFEAGAKAANPAVSVTTVYHPAADNAFNDPVWGAGEAKKQLAQGADIIFGAGGNTGNGALQEVAKASGAGTDKFCIGVDTDQWDTVPAAQPCLVTSAMKLISEGVTDIAVKAKAGDFTELQTLGKAGLAPFHDFDSVVPADVKAKVDEVVKQMEAGTLQTGVDPLTDVTSGPRYTPDPSHLVTGGGHPPRVPAPGASAVHHRRPRHPLPRGRDTPHCGHPPTLESYERDTHGGRAAAAPPPPSGASSGRAATRLPAPGLPADAPERGRDRRRARHRAGSSARP